MIFVDKMDTDWLKEPSEEAQVWADRKAAERAEQEVYW